MVATIASGGSLSAVIDTGGLPICGIQMSAGWDAAAMTFQAAADLPANVASLYDSSGIEVNVTVAASTFIYIDPSIFAGVRYLKVRSGTAGTPVTQSATRAIVLALRTV